MSYLCNLFFYFQPLSHDNKHLLNLIKTDTLLFAHLLEYLQLFLDDNNVDKESD